MKNKIIGILTLFGTLLLLTGCGLTRDLKQVNAGQETIIVGLDETFVPMGFRAKNGELTGFDIDLAQAVSKQIKQKIAFQPIDWDMKETELKNGTIDLIWNGYSKTPAREKSVLFSQSYLSNSQVVITRKKSNITKIADLTGKKVGLQQGSSGQMLYDEKPQLLKQRVKETVLYDTFNNAFLDLKAGRIDAIMGDSIYINYYVRESGEKEQYQLVETPFMPETFAIGMRPQDQQLKGRIDAALKSLEANGTMTKLSERWFQEDLSIPEK
ncbi:amino acid ABC transporter substrate-binding protein [Amylolactobacillus amylotrophicus DSM 20534]|uniref:Amino acid ABC transporter substrate-binding protein n=4 Tax=Amylolactobacillus TaxID=2767876 RepID=A0A0R1YGB2_9LACO|nr:MULTISPECIES: amino acid ABC transporter substrate-binding protein [Amylolactobacillus]APT18672.1 hypothetical protein LA20533_05070 [Amylolactobacillus amylophilus DSM 20533 = JCM 1125]KRK37764.1 amino acid ABC transporter substrate-binding protein [Amylolactobacillus amylotrophicus DSM 20534]KRM41552.1 amino acid ABC transporter substrate-binding protein [Amylolactobacillus amylophilus DSM 20533 = JCM 1125]GED80782.1 amino acid ABC transporter substrate-binding protein [Amylolactobacillus 